MNKTVTVKAIKDDDKIEPATPWIYLHGAIEKENGFDLVYIPDKPDKDGVYEANILVNDNSVAGVLFYWKAGKIDRGLVVKKGDKEFLNDALAKFNKRTPYL